MSYLIVPARVTADSATVWIGTIDDPQPPTLFANGVAQPLPVWTRLTGGPHVLSYARIRIAGLAAHARCELQLKVGTRVMAVGSVTTLPRELPTATGSPFTALLGSCFYSKNDQGFGRTFLGMPLPDMKILCGDQVYLDAPWTDFATNRHSQPELERRFFETYQATWEQASPGTGFRQVLQDGANYFSSDDHEFWNNAPTFASFAPDTWTDGGRKAWWNTAAALYDAFQNDRTIENFSIGPVSFLFADTRRHRDSDRNQLMTTADWDRVCGWVAGLQGPGVMVIGQPVFWAKGGIFDRFTDWNLPDFAQYRRLAEALYNARHSIVVLTGDVHFGRVAYCQLPNASNGFQPRLTEIISSPLALLDRKVGGNWSKAPAAFPAFGIPGLGRLPVTTVDSFQMRQDHFLTVELTGVTGGARMKVRSWPIVPNPANPAGRQVFADTLY